ncbi:probable E3 SUMO-protein ligase RNF212 [Bombus fervidus]
MDMFICNKCFATPHRGKKPFCLTQCGHIYCNGCIQQAEKQCPQCQQIDIFSVELQQPSLSKVENFFAPLNESLESLHKICGFQNNQMKIMIQRFHEIDKKYETLKSHYYSLTQNMKMMRDKYIKLKMENTEQKKKLMSFEMQNRTLNSLSDVSTPIKSGNNRSSKMRPASNSYFSCGANMSSQSFDVRKGNAMFEGFRIPYPHIVRSVGSRGTSDTNSTYL